VISVLGLAVLTVVGWTTGEDGRRHPLLAARIKERTDVHDFDRARFSNWQDRATL
jgi:hypothetical protein